MTNRYVKPLFFVMVGALLISCAAQRPQTSFQPHDLNPKLRQYVQKVDNFLVILDASASMDEAYQGQAKFTFAKEIVSHMNQTIPNLKLTGGLRTFGHSFWPFTRKTTLVYGLTPYSKIEFEDALKTVKWANARSPLNLAIDGASKDLKSARGKIAVIIVSDGKDINNAPVLAAINMKKLFGDRLCIYSVLVGNDPAGGKIMEQVAKEGLCGFSVSANSIASAEAIADFVEKVFFEKAKAIDSDGDGVLDNLDRCPKTPKGVKVDRHGCPLDTDGDGIYDYLDACPKTPRGVTVDKKGCPPDSDGDGVDDYLDQCPGTPKGAKVNDKGCWILERIHFDTGKWDIKPDAYPALDEVMVVLENNPALRVEIEGHTDNVGSEAYNRKLSENRARAVMEYLVKKGAQTERLSSVGYGFSMPIAPNDTPAGRAKNRRVELTPMP